ncbi:acetylglutamate kinase [Paenibacillus sp. SC116]|uniref:acetylglutamate kinase n=1 Tax=Paenibacillus sp. SC116 TaxID=2968986 RepID=UPI00215B24EA|nr:acetylglutamate kinase [Paenibacillus sp. SC116]MCR8845330.1 acetylglutamate kinase [Paenibacillus sp. SC116]
MYMYPIGIPVYQYPIRAEGDHTFQTWVRSGYSTSAVQLMNLMRTLWEQHVAWTRMTIISIAEGLADEAAVTQRLLRNVPDMAVVFRHFYGSKVASRFETLFRDHLVIAAELVKAAKAGDSAKTADAEKRWYANADQLAEFFSSINPYWPKEEVKKMFYEHLALTKSEAAHRLTKDYAADIADFDEIEKQALLMADMFSNGLIQQFPSVFTS